MNLKWIIVQILFPMMCAYDISSLKSLYYQIYSNNVASNVQRHSTCVISTFGVAKNNNFIEFIFQGIGQNKTINKFFGEMRQENSSGCFRFHSTYPHNNHYICLIDYHSNFDWVLFGNLAGSALFGMVSNRTSESQQNELQTSMLKLSDASDIITFNHTNCDMFIPD